MTCYVRQVPLLLGPFSQDVLLFVVKPPNRYNKAEQKVPAPSMYSNDLTSEHNCAPGLLGDRCPRGLVRATDFAYAEPYLIFFCQELPFALEDFFPTPCGWK